jgi:Protein of unknown function (DUF4031)
MSNKKMPVYVGKAIYGYGRMIMCHLWANSEDELLQMIDIIGVNKKWIQKPPKASWLHFDICKSKRTLTIKNIELVERLRDREKKKDRLASPS